ncbi:MAG: hypothetical protein ABIC82_01370 [bacterium]
MKPKTLYRDILKNAFNIAFKNKTLWFFGLLAAPLMGMAEYKIAANIFEGTNGGFIFGEWSQIINTVISQFGNISNLLAENPAALIILLAFFSVIILFVFFLFWIAVVAQGALIDGINQTNSKTMINSKPNTSISCGIKNFFPVLGIHFFVKLGITLSFLLLSLPIVVIAIGNNDVLPKILYFVFSLIFIPIIIIIMFSSKYAINYIIIEKENFFDGIKKGYRMFFDNWLISIEMSLILFFISVFAGLFIVVVGSFIILPITLLIYILIQIKLIFLVKFVLVLGLLILIILSLFFTAIFSVFQYSNWVLLFNRLKKGGEKEKGKLARWFSFEH